MRMFLTGFEEPVFLDLLHLNWLEAIGVLIAVTWLQEVISPVQEVLTYQQLTLRKMVAAHL